MHNEKIILLVEDNEKLNYANSEILTLNGYTVHTALTLSEARAVLAVTEPDVILLDIMLPDGDGFDFCAEIRDSTQAAVVFLTAKTEHEDIIHGYNIGADYLMKPFHPKLLVAKVENVLRQHRHVKEQTPANVLSFGRLTLNIITGRAFVDGADLNLQPKEFSLLRFFGENENKTVSTEYIFETLWNQPMAGDKNALQAAVSRLRKKIEPIGYKISLTRDKGYKFWKN